MPIRPENRDRYPADWPEISLAVKEAAGWRCECTGECGRALDHLSDLDWRCWNHHQQAAYGTGSLVVLTTAHLDHTPENCSVENLRAMCQGCHLHYDRGHHAETRARTRAADVAEGQGVLLDVEPPPLERVQALVKAGEIRVCRQSKPLSENDARVLLEFHELLSNQSTKNRDQEDR